MQDITLRGVPQVPDSEFSEAFAQGMLDRMQMSYFKYGLVEDAYPSKVDAIKSLKKRLEKYEADGNTEWLMDVANFAMIEFMRPRHPQAHFKSTDSHESPGRVRDDVRDAHDRNIVKHEYRREGD